MKILALVMTPLLLSCAPATAATPNTNTTEQRAAAPPTAKPVKDILYARPFTLVKGYRNDWSKARELVSSGVLIVLEVDPLLVVPRNAAEPVLYAGDTPVQRLNHADKSGRLIGIVPGKADLAGAPIWFGASGLPERVTAETARAERARAEQSGIRPFTTEKVRSVTRPPVSAEDLAALLRDHAAALVIEYSPQEKDLADAWRLPVGKAPPKEPR
jgi:hypothetical protein